MRGGLDDALDKLARRDELRRRAAGEATGTAPAVHELVEAIAAVVGRNPKLEVTVGVEGVGDPTLLHFYVEGGMVQVNADSSVASRVTEVAPTSPRHADFDIDVDEPLAETPVTPVPQRPAHAAPPAYSPSSDAGQQSRRISYDDRDRYDPGTGYGTTPYGEPDPYSRPEPAHETSRHASRESPAPADETVVDDNRYRSPFAATPPPPVPPQTPRRIRPEQHRAPEEPSAAERSRAAEQDRRADQERRAERERTRADQDRRADLDRRADHEPSWVAAHQHATAEPRGMPTPLPEPIPLHVDSAETEMAARRLAAMLRDNPSLLRPAPHE